MAVDKVYYRLLFLAMFLYFYNTTFQDYTGSKLDQKFPKYYTEGIHDPNWKYILDTNNYNYYQG